MTTEEVAKTFGEAISSPEEWYKEGSAEFNSYFSSLKLKASQANPKSLCCFCWCLLSNYQKERHMESHATGIRTPYLYTNSLDVFRDLAKSYGHSREINKIIEFRRIRDEPEKKTQIAPMTKKMKINVEKEESKVEPIAIKLVKNAEETNSLTSTTSVNKLNQEIQQKQVLINFI